MNSNRKVTLVAALLLVALFTGAVASRQRIEQLRGKQSTLEEVLYLPSGKAVKRVSLGYSGLLADIYWTRAVQYFGEHHIAQAQRYDLLAPLLDITTDLDPHLIVAYENGAIFLSQQRPDGAGQPEKAVALIEKGIRENPAYWRLYFTLGFVQYIDRHDPKAAQEAFQRGSEIPGALPWMKIMAARMAEHSKDITTAMALWQTIAQNTTDKMVKDTATRHLVSLEADRDIDDLEQKVRAYRERTGSWPANWRDVVRAGLVPGIPVAPRGEPYVLRSGGAVDVSDPSQYRYLGEWRKNLRLPF
jgi:tetratricopeptide (TPR) repeat protein